MPTRQTILNLGGGVPPHRPPPAVRESALGGEGGWVTVDRSTMATAFPNIGRAITGRGKAGAFDGHGQCFVEIGDSKAGFGNGNSYAEPRPRIAMSAPGWHWHAGKVAFEKSWLRRWF
jgi:sulfide:quinone oxidoreductase